MVRPAGVAVGGYSNNPDWADVPSEISATENRYRKALDFEEIAQKNKGKIQQSFLDKARTAKNTAIKHWEVLFKKESSEASYRLGQHYIRESEKVSSDKVSSDLEDALRQKAYFYFELTCSR